MFNLWSRKRILTKVNCKACLTEYEKNKLEDPCPECGSLEVTLLPLTLAPKRTVLTEEQPTLSDELMDAFDPSKGMNLNLIDPENVDKNMMIIMLGKDDNKFGICTERFRVIKRDGDKLILEPYDEKGPEAAREEIANFIVQLHEKEIKDSAVGMVKKALMRKPIKKLEKLKEKSKPGVKGKLKTMTGCVYLVIGDEEVLL